MERDNRTGGGGVQERGREGGGVQEKQFKKTQLFFFSGQSSFACLVYLGRNFGLFTGGLAPTRIVNGLVLPKRRQIQTLSL